MGTVDSIRQPNTYLAVVPEEENENKVENMFKEIMAKILSKLINSIEVQIQGGH